MKRVEHIRLNNCLTVGTLVSEMKACGVLGAGNIGRAAEIVTEMFRERDYTVFLTLAGPLVPGGLKHIIRDLIEQEYVNAVVTTGANMVHDMVEALGFRHWIGTFLAQDEELKDKEIGRIGDIYIEQNAFKGVLRCIIGQSEFIGGGEGHIAGVVDIDDDVILRVCRLNEAQAAEHGE